MPTTHDEARREQALSLHRRHKRVCSACGQSWPCTEYEWAGGKAEARRRRRLRRLVVRLAIVAALAIVLVTVEIFVIIRLIATLGTGS